MFIALAIFTGSCAKIEPPPGGRPDQIPPRLMATRPDSLAVYPGFKGEVEIIFDEVVSEGSQPSMGLGTSDLEKLIILSPTENVPRVHWKRSVIGVEPKEGWRPSRVYRIEVLPGITDLQRNRLDSGTVITFTTGAPLPTATLSGLVVDWVAGRPAQRALIDAILLPDSLRYRALSDSSGRFSFGPLPPGEYLVYGVIDQNRNLRRDLRDNFDTVRVRGDSAIAVGTLWAIPHDTLGPRLQNAVALDSLAADLTFNQPLDPYQQFDTTNVLLLLLPDSSPVPLAAVRPRAVDDSIQQELQRERARAADTGQRADTSRAAALDSARQAAEARLKPAADTTSAILSARPKLFDHLLVRVLTPFIPGRQYAVMARAIRNVTGIAADSRQLLNVPERPPPAPPADSLAPAPADSTRPDSLPPPRPP